MNAYWNEEYICQANESFDSVAMRIYGHERYTADLMNGNPDYCGMCVFNGGERLKIPKLDVPEDARSAEMANTIAPWKV